MKIMLKKILVILLILFILFCSNNFYVLAKEVVDLISDDIVNNGIVLRMTSDKNETSTGLSHKVVIDNSYANPNDEDLGICKIYLKDTYGNANNNVQLLGLVDNKKVFSCDNNDDLSVTIELKEEKNSNDQIVKRWLEYTLNPGSSVQMELEFLVSNGLYGKEENLILEPDISHSISTGNNDKISEPLNLKWTSDFVWENLQEFSNIDSLNINESRTGLQEDITYTYSADCKNLENSGEIWTDKIVVKDTISLIEDMEINGTIKVENGILYSNDIKIFEILIDENYDGIYTIDDLSYDLNNKEIKYQITLNNKTKQEISSEFNPLGAITTKLYTQSIPFSNIFVSDGTDKIENTIVIDFYPVVNNIEPIELTTKKELFVNRNDTIILKKSSDKSVSKKDEKVNYSIEMQNHSKTDLEETLYDYLPEGLSITDSSTDTLRSQGYTVGASSIIFKDTIDDTGNFSLDCNFSSDNGWSNIESNYNKNVGYSKKLNKGATVEYDIWFDNNTFEGTIKANTNLLMGVDSSDYSGWVDSYTDILSKNLVKEDSGKYKIHIITEIQDKYLNYSYLHSIGITFVGCNSNYSGKIAIDNIIFHDGLIENIIGNEDIELTENFQNHSEAKQVDGDKVWGKDVSFDKNNYWDSNESENVMKWAFDQYFGKKANINGDIEIEFDVIMKANTWNNGVIISQVAIMLGDNWNWFSNQYQLQKDSMIQSTSNVYKQHISIVIPTDYLTYSALQSIQISFIGSGADFSGQIYIDNIVVKAQTLKNNALKKSTLLKKEEKISTVIETNVNEREENNLKNIAVLMGNYIISDDVDLRILKTEESKEFKLEKIIQTRYINYQNNKASSKKINNSDEGDISLFGAGDLIQYTVKLTNYTNEEKVVHLTDYSPYCSSAYFQDNEWHIYSQYANSKMYMYGKDDLLEFSNFDNLYNDFSKNCIQYYTTQNGMKFTVKIPAGKELTQTFFVLAPSGEDYEEYLNSIKNAMGTNQDKYDVYNYQNDKLQKYEPDNTICIDGSEISAKVDHTVESRYYLSKIPIAKNTLEEYNTNQKANINYYENNMYIYDNDNDQVISYVIYMVNDSIYDLNLNDTTLVNTIPKGWEFLSYDYLYNEIYRGNYNSGNTSNPYEGNKKYVYEDNEYELNRIHITKGNSNDFVNVVNSYDEVNLLSVIDNSLPEDSPYRFLNKGEISKDGKTFYGVREAKNWLGVANTKINDNVIEMQFNGTQLSAGSSFMIFYSLKTDGKSNEVNTSERSYVTWTFNNDKVIKVSPNIDINLYVDSEYQALQGYSKNIGGCYQTSSNSIMSNISMQPDNRTRGFITTGVLGRNSLQDIENGKGEINYQAKDLNTYSNSDGEVVTFFTYISNNESYNIDAGEIKIILPNGFEYIGTNSIKPIQEQTTYNTGIYQSYVKTFPNYNAEYMDWFEGIMSDTTVNRREASEPVYYLTSLDKSKEVYNAYKQNYHNTNGYAEDSVRGIIAAYDRYDYAKQAYLMDNNLKFKINYSNDYDDISNNILTFSSEEELSAKSGIYLVYSCLVHKTDKKNNKENNTQLALWNTKKGLKEYWQQKVYYGWDSPYLNEVINPQYENIGTCNSFKDCNCISTNDYYDERSGASYFNVKNYSSVENSLWSAVNINQESVSAFTTTGVLGRNRLSEMNEGNATINYQANDLNVYNLSDGEVVTLFTYVSNNSNTDLEAGDIYINLPKGFEYIGNNYFEPQSRMTTYAGDYEVFSKTNPPSYNISSLEEYFDWFECGTVTDKVQSTRTATINVYYLSTLNNEPISNSFDEENFSDLTNLRPIFAAYDRMDEKKIPFNLNRAATYTANYESDAYKTNCNILKFEGEGIINSKSGVYIAYTCLVHPDQVSEENSVQTAIWTTPNTNIQEYIPQKVYYGWDSPYFGNVINVEYENIGTCNYLNTETQDERSGAQFLYNGNEVFEEEKSLWSAVDFKPTGGKEYYLQKGVVGVNSKTDMQEGEAKANYLTENCKIVSDDDVVTFSIFLQNSSGTLDLSKINLIDYLPAGYEFLGFNYLTEKSYNCEETQHIEYKNGIPKDLSVEQYYISPLEEVCNITCDQGNSLYAYSNYHRYDGLSYRLAFGENITCEYEYDKENYNNYKYGEKGDNVVKFNLTGELNQEEGLYIIYSCLVHGDYVCTENNSKYTENLVYFMSEEDIPILSDNCVQSGYYHDKIYNAISVSGIEKNGNMGHCMTANVSVDEELNVTNYYNLDSTNYLWSGVDMDYQGFPSLSDVGNIKISKSFVDLNGNMLKGLETFYDKNYEFYVAEISSDDYNKIQNNEKITVVQDKKFEINNLRDIYEVQIEELANINFEEGKYYIFGEIPNENTKIFSIQSENNKGINNGIQFAFQYNEDDSFHITFTNQILKRGTIEINKCDEKSEKIDLLENPITYALKDNYGDYLNLIKISDTEYSYILEPNENSISQILTNQNPIKITNLPVGKYKIEEIKAPEGYKKSEDTLVTIKNEDYLSEKQMKIVNKKYTGDRILNIRVLDKDTNTLIYDEALVSIKIKDEDKNCSVVYVGSDEENGNIYRLAYEDGVEQEETTDILKTKNGKIKVTGFWKDIDYVVQETKEPYGYALNSHLNNVKFELQENEKTVEIEHQRFVFDFVIRKIDENDNIINNTTKFSLYNSKDEVLHFKKNDSNLLVYEDGKPIEYSSYYTYVLPDKVTEDCVTELETYNGVIYINDLDQYKLGTNIIETYNLKEVEPPDGFDIQTTIAKIYYNGIYNTLTLNDGEKDFKVKYKNITNKHNIANLKINKIGNDNNLIETSYAQFEVYRENTLVKFEKVENENNSYYIPSDNGNTTLETIKGIVNIRNLPLGQYEIKEIKAPDNYQILTDKVDVNLTYLNYYIPKEVNIKNSSLVGNLYVNKVNKDDEKLFGASFNIINSNGDFLKFNKQNSEEYIVSNNGSEIITLENGNARILNLPLGTYTIKEIKSPNGYLIGKDTEVTIEEKNAYTDKELNIVNEHDNGNLEILKYDTKGKLIESNLVTFNLYDENNNLISLSYNEEKDEENGRIYYYDAKGSYKNVISYNGKITINNLPVGKYYLEEIVAPDGYSRLKDLIPLEIIPENYYEKNSIIVQNPEYVFGSEEYVSTSYQKIEENDNELNFGYGYYGKVNDYDSKRYNYIIIDSKDDLVKYSLRVTNMSKKNYENIVMINKLPDTNDFGTVNLNEKRESEFTVSLLDNPNFTVKLYDLNGLEMPIEPSNYEISYSDNVKFTNADWDGVSIWDNKVKDNTKSFRVKFSDEFVLPAGYTISIIFEGEIRDNAKPGAIAWNSFGYRYYIGDKQLTPEPPKVGVKIPYEPEITKYTTENTNEIFNFVVKDIENNKVISEVQAKSGESIKLEKLKTVNGVTSGYLESGKKYRIEEKITKSHILLDVRSKTAKKYQENQTCNKNNYEFIYNPEEEAKVTFINSPRNEAVVKINKLDKFNNRPLENVKYNLLDSNGNIIRFTKKDETYFLSQDDKAKKDLITNSDGIVLIKNLPYGTYKLQEVDAPKGYIVDSNVTEFIIDDEDYRFNEEGNIENILTEFNFENDYKAKGDITIKAIKLLEGQQLRENQFKVVLNSEDGSKVLETSNNEFGEFILNLEFNETQIGEHIYYLSEINTQEEGYEYDNRIYKIIIKVIDNYDGTLEVIRKDVDNLIFNNRFYDDKNIQEFDNIELDSKNKNDEMNIVEKEVKEIEDITTEDITTEDITAEDITTGDNIIYYISIMIICVLGFIISFYKIKKSKDL